MGLRLSLRKSSCVLHCKNHTKYTISCFSQSPSALFACFILLLRWLVFRVAPLAPAVQDRHMSFPPRQVSRAHLLLCCVCVFVHFFPLLRLGRWHVFRVSTPAVLDWQMSFPPRQVSRTRIPLFLRLYRWLVFRVSPMAPAVQDKLMFHPPRQASQGCVWHCLCCVCRWFRAAFLFSWVA